VSDYTFSFYMKEEYKKFFFFKRERWTRYHVPMSEEQFEAMGSPDSPQWEMFWRALAIGRQSVIDVSSVQTEEVSAPTPYIPTWNGGDDDVRREEV